MVGMLQYMALQTHEQIGAEHDLPPALNLRIVRHSIIGPTQFVFRMFQAVFNPGAQAIGIADGLLNLAFEIPQKFRIIP